MHTYAARLGMFLLLSSVVAGCAAKAGENPLPEYRGTMRSSCAPHDAPSTELRLEAAEGKVWVYFNLWPTEGVNPPSTVRFDTDRVKAAARAANPRVEVFEISSVTGAGLSPLMKRMEELCRRKTG